MRIVVAAPASKSLSHRALIAAALAPGVSTVRHVLDGADLERTRDVLSAAGAELVPIGCDAWRVCGMVAGPAGGKAEPVSCDVGESGTTCRLLTAVLAAGQGRFRVHGAPRMHERPSRVLTDVLEALGAEIVFAARSDCPPLEVRARGLAGGEVVVSLDASSQYLSGLLLAAPLCRTPLRVTIGGRKAVSWPYVGLTLQTLDDFGIGFRVATSDQEEWRAADWRSVRRAEPGRLRISVRPGAYRPGVYSVEGDWSGASYLLAAGAVGRNPVAVAGLRSDSLQGDRVIVDLLRRMGAAVESAADGTILVSPGPLHGIEADMGDCPDLVPTVAVLAAFASGVTRIGNVAHLRIKESDRIAAPVEELRKAGVRAEEREDGLVIYGLGPERPRPPADTLFCVHNDHRIAMSLALLGVDGGTVRLDNPGVVRKSFPQFWDVWKKLMGH